MSNQLQIAQQWLDITVERFLRNIKTLRIGSTGELAASFRAEVIGAAGSDQIKLRVAYSLYGQFVDMGVGRGMAAGISKDQKDFEKKRNSLGQLRRHLRRPKPWYSKEIGYQSHRLAELMSEATGEILISTLASALPASASTINL